MFGVRRSQWNFKPAVSIQCLQNLRAWAHKVINHRYQRNRENNTPKKPTPLMDFNVLGIEFRRNVQVGTRALCMEERTGQPSQRHGVPEMLCQGTLCRQLYVPLKENPPKTGRGRGCHTGCHHNRQVWKEWNQGQQSQSTLWNSKTHVMPTWQSMVKRPTLELTPEPTSQLSLTYI